MKKTMKKLVATCLVLALGIAGFTFSTGRAEAADDLTEKWVDVQFSQPMRVKWNWNDFLTNALTADVNKNLSVAGMVISQAAEYSRAQAEAVLTQLGFGDLKSDYYLLSTDTKNSIEQPARTFGHKLLQKDGKEYHIICAVFKGTTTLDDAVTDINSIVDGFKKAGENCEKSLDTYVKGISGATKDNTIMYITGHSLGASTANVVGLLCSDLVSDASKFVYTYASPNYKTNSAGDEKSEDSYKNFIRFTNADDAVPLVPPTNKLKHFGHLGRDVYYNLAGLDTDTRAKFDRVYKYMTGKTFDNDTNKIKNHLGDTYMSFILSDGLTNDQITEYLSPTATPAPGSTVAPGTTATPGTTTAPSASPAASAAPGATTTPTASPAPTADPGTVTPPAAELQPNPMNVTGKTAKAKANKKTTLKVGKVLDVDDAEGNVTYKKKSGNGKITIKKTSGKVTVKKGLKKGKVYKVKVKVTAAGNDEYQSKTLTRTFKIKIK